MANINEFLDKVSYSPVRDFINREVKGLKKSNDLEVVGIGGFTTYATTRNKRTMTATAPNIYMENGTVVNDTVWLEPIEIVIEGVVSDIFVDKKSQQNVITDVKRAVGVVNAYLPNRTQSQINKINALSNDVYSAIDKIDNLVSTSKQLAILQGQGASTKSLQEQFIDKIDSIYYSKALIDIETPYRKYENMMILSYETEVNGESNEIKFIINAKEIRFVESNFTRIQFNFKPSKDLQGQLDSLSENGDINKSDNVPVQKESIASSVFDFIFN